MDFDISKLNYRKLNANDTVLFVRLRFQFFTNNNRNINQTEKDEMEIYLKEYFNKHIATGDFIGMICEYEKSVISAAYLVIIEWPSNLNFVNGMKGILVNIFTEKEYRKKGIATNIIKKLIEEAKKKGVKTIELSATEAGEKMYTEIGFKESEYKRMKLEL
jgi:GNAT superfamily N-acetyltransferase